MSALPLNLVHVASGDLWAGAEVQLYHLARALHARPEVRLRVVLLNHGMLEERLRDAGIAVHVLDEKTLGLPRLIAGLRSRLRRFEAHVVHSHRYKENLLTAIAARGVGCVAVRSIHSLPDFPGHLRGRAVRWADALSARWQQAGVCVSPELLPRMEAALPRLPLEVIENGIDFDRLDQAAREPVDETLFGPGLRVAFVARLVTVKRPDIFVATAHHIARDLPGRASFHLFGEGPLEEQCRSFLTRHRLTSSVRLLGFRPNMPAWLARCDLLVLCSDHEGLPMVLLEAMGLGIPVIVHAVGGMPHVVGAGKFGTLVRHHSPEGYASALRDIIHDRRRAVERAGLARVHARTHYDIRQVIERYLDFYARTMRRPVGAPPLVRPEASR